MAKITILGVEVDEDKLMSVVQKSKKKNENFNEQFFSDKLEELKQSVEGFSKAGVEFKKDYITAKRMYDQLSKVNEWFSEYCYQEHEPKNAVLRTKRMIHVHSRIENFKQIGEQLCVMVDGFGLFALVDLYIIPFSLVDCNFSSQLDCLRNVSLVTNFSNPDRIENPFNLPDDGLYGSSRPITTEHFAVVVNDVNNPICKYLEKNTSWRYVSSDGSSL